MARRHHPSPRNLTDKQLDAISDSDGLVGINFHVGFLNPKGDAATSENTPLTWIADHLDYIANRIGIDKVALGSDFDGARMPGDLVNAGGLPKLMAELKRRGYDEDALMKIGYRTGSASSAPPGRHKSLRDRSDPIHLPGVRNLHTAHHVVVVRGHRATGRPPVDDCSPTTSCHALDAIAPTNGLVAASKSRVGPYRRHIVA